MTPDKRDAAQAQARAEKKRKRPKVKSREELPHEEPPNWDKEHPVFCLRHVHRDHDLKNADFQIASKAAFAVRLQTLASMTWNDIRLADRHGYGSEKLPVDDLSISLPSSFEDEDHVTVLRYDGLLPMVGVRRQSTFHILAIERQFGELYDHGD